MRGRMYYGVALLMLLCWSTITTSAQQGKGHAYLQPDSIVIGDQVRMTLKVVLPKGSCLLKMPEVPDTFQLIEVLQRGTLDSVVNQNETEYFQEFVVTSFDSGYYALPKWWASIYNGNTATQDSIAIQPTYLYVNTIAEVDTSKPFKPIFEIDAPAAPDLWTKVREGVRKYWPWILGGLIGLLILLVMAYFIWKKRKNTRRILVETPHQKASRRIRELEASSFWINGQYKEYYTELSDLIKTYLEEVCKIQAQEMTTRDLLRTVKKHSDWRRIHGELRAILEHADLTKFAKSVPTEQDKDDDIRNAYKIIKALTPTQPE